LRVRSSSEVELSSRSVSQLVSLKKSEKNQLTERVPSRKTMIYMLRGSRYVGE
jgi:hypothetical protein